MKQNENVLYQRILEFETEENIDLFNSCYGNLWPMFKMHISRNLLTNGHIPKYNNNLFRTLIKLKTHLSIIKNYKFKKFKKANVDTNTNEIWFSNHELRYENTDNYNKYLDPFFINLSGGKALMYERTIKYADEYSFPHFTGKRNIKNLLPLVNKHNNKYLTKRFFLVNKNGFNEFKNKKISKLLVQYFPDCNLYSLFLEYLNFIESYHFYTCFFSKFTALKKVYLVAYYMTDRMAMLATANKKKIKTVDIQHSFMTKKHVAYGLWNYVPAGGYELLPNYFYVFSKKEKALLNEVFKEQHKIKIIENYTFKNWVSERQEKQEHKKTIILVALQNTLIYDNDFFLNALLHIQKHNKNINFVFRLHPRHTYVKEGVEKTLKKVKLNFYWDKNSEIFDTLLETIINITSFSSVVNDALLFNIPSIIYTEKGIGVFKDEIKNNPLVHSALNSHDFLKILNKYI